MPRKFIEMGCLAKVTVERKKDPGGPVNLKPGFLIHSLRVEDTFFSSADFLAAMGLSKTVDLMAANPGVTAYNHCITCSSWCVQSLGKFSIVVWSRKNQSPSLTTF
jgi:hypothetical protein